MQTSINQLRQKIADSERYWRSKNLAQLYIMQDILPVLRKALEDAVLAVRKFHTIDTDDPKNLVKCVHYTTMRVLVQMLSQQEKKTPATLRLYDSIHLNDPDEGRYLARQITSVSKYGWMEQYFENVLLGNLPERSIENAYITSFVVGKGVEDNLVFWRTYGREGTGCSIEFSVDSNCLKHVIYGKNGAKPTIGIIGKVLDCLEPIVKSTEKEVHSILTAHVWTSLKGISYLYKSTAYDYERECRVVVLESEADSDDIRFDYQDSATGLPRIRHYIEPTELIVNDILPSGSRVTIGPCVPFADNIRRRLSTIAARSDMAGRPEIRISKISYRSS